MKSTNEEVKLPEFFNGKDAPSFLHNVRIVGRLSDRVADIVQEHNNRFNGEDIPDVVITPEVQPMMFMSPELQSAHAKNDSAAIAEIEKKAQNDLRPVYEAIGEHELDAWFEAYDEEAKETFLMAFNNDAVLWIYPGKTEEVVGGDEKPKFVKTVSIGSYTNNSGCAIAGMLGVESPVRVVISVAMLTVLSLVFSQLTKRITVESMEALLNQLATRIGLQATIHVPGVVATLLKYSVLTVLTVLGTLLVNWIVSLLAKTYYVQVDVYNWDEENAWKLGQRHEGNAKIVGDADFSKFVLPKKQVPELPPFIKPVIIKDVAVSYGTIIWQNDSTFMQGLGVALQFLRQVGGGFAWAFDCPWARNNKHGADDGVYSSIDEYFKTVHWRDTPTEFKIMSCGMPISLTLNALSGAKGNLYRIRIDIGKREGVAGDSLK